METFTKMLNLVVNNWEVISGVILVILTIVKVFRSKGISNAEKFDKAITLVINTLKDETKMKDDGTEFDPKVKSKLEDIGKKMEMGKEEVEKVKEAFSYNKYDKKGTKIGSHNGKPIYLESVIDTVSSVKRLKNLF